MLAVIDTNVLLVANEDHPGVSPECIASCVKNLNAIQKSGITVIDDQFLVLLEYQRKTRLKPPKGVGDVFLKWLLRNRTNVRHVHQVKVTPSDADSFVEFPSEKLQSQFDPSDRKFVAIANSHPSKPPIWQAVDSKWLGWIAELQAQNIHVELLCQHEVQRFHEKKFQPIKEKGERENSLSKLK